MAMEAYHKALAIKSDYAAAYCNMGVVLADQSKFDEAIMPTGIPFHSILIMLKFITTWVVLLQGKVI